MVVRTAGDLDLSTVGEVERALAAARPDGRGHVVLDLRGVTFLDSTAIVVLVEPDAGARRAGRRLSVIPGGRATRMLLELTGCSGCSGCST